jgi:glycogen operon protein
MALSGDTGEHAAPDDPFLLMFNAWWEPINFAVPEALRNLGWHLEIDTAHPAESDRNIDTSAVPVTERSLVMLRGTQPRS